MKVLTLTTQYANNYGAQLQCYALSKYLNGLPDVECEVIQYFHPRSGVSWTTLRMPKDVRELVKMIYTILNVPMVISLNIKKRRMRAFINSYIPLTRKQYHSADSIRNNPPIADAYICGSDQIWNMKYYFDGKTIYFLDFVPEGKKRIAYAASIADPWKEEHIEMLRPHLQKFDAIAIREKGNLSQLKTIYPHATVTIDPVFLLSRKEWDELKNTDLCPKEPYMLCYFLSVDDSMVEIVRRVRELTGLKIVHLNLNALDKFNSEKVIRTADPRDFIGLISGASMICTNSFHCSAFSVIYKRDFVFCPKSMANERVITLQETFAIGNVIMTADRLSRITKEDLRVDYSNSDECGGKVIAYSKTFIKEALYGKNN